MKDVRCASPPAVSPESLSAPASWVPKVGDRVTGHNVLSWREGRSNPIRGLIKSFENYENMPAADVDGIFCAIESLRLGDEVAPVPGSVEVQPSPPPTCESCAPGTCRPEYHWRDEPKAKKPDPYAEHRKRADVLSIRKLRGSFTLAELAKRFGVCRNTIWNIQHGANWADVKP